MIFQILFLPFSALNYGGEVNPLQRLKRILIIANQQSPIIQERGQVGLQGGYEVFFYSFPGEKMKGLGALLISMLNHLGKGSIFLSPFFLISFIRRIQPDLIHVIYAYQGLDTLLLARFRPLMVTVMGGDILPDQSFNGPRKWMIKKILNTADIITSKSIFLDVMLNQIGNHAHKIRRVTWGVDTKQFQPGLDVGLLRQRWGIHPEDIVFFCPRICHPFYNQHLIIQAFAYWIRRNTSRMKAKLLISELLAEESYSKQLRRLAKELGLTDYVYFVGTIPHQEMPAYLNLSDIMIAIPPSDGMPQSLYEAMACGTYPIMGNLECYREFIQDGVNGRLVEVSDVEALGEAMCWAASHPEHLKTTAIINRQRILEVADKEGQDRIVLSIYGELLKKFGAYSNPDNKKYTVSNIRNSVSQL